MIKITLLSSDLKVDCEIREDNTELAMGLELDLELEFTRSVNFEKEAAELYIREYGKKGGFVIKRYRMQLSSDGSPESNGVYVSFMNLEHNVKFAAAFRKFDQDIMSKIEHAVIYGHCNAHTIRNLLQPSYPDQLFLTQDLSNAIQKIKCKHKITGSDASQLLKYLLKKQKNEPMMFIQHLINMDSDKLCVSMQSTQRVESINALIYKAVSASSTIADVVEVLDSRMQKEALNKSFIVWKYKSTTFYQPFIVLFSIKLRAIYIIQYINDLFYGCWNEIPLVDDQNNEDSVNIGDHYDLQQAYLKTLISSVSKESIQEFQDNIWNKVELASIELFIGASSKRLKSSYDNILQRTYLIPKHYDNVQENYVHLHMRKKLYYGQLMGHFKKALHYSMEDNNQNVLYKHEILRENTNLNYEIKLSNGRVLDVNTVKVPLEHIDKAYNEKENKYKVNNSDTNNTVGGRKYGLCHKTGHYAPKCPTKNSDC
ncbi:23331_t:CDS:2 [Gigaspora rosea]|nr:23331_t:CDS:2 [Gigaspora rosea]